MVKAKVLLTVKVRYFLQDEDSYELANFCSIGTAYSHVKKSGTISLHPCFSTVKEQRPSGLEDDLYFFTTNIDILLSEIKCSSKQIF